MLAVPDLTITDTDYYTLRDTVSVTHAGYPCLGTDQYLLGDNSGKFLPGIFRVNPVTIQKTVGICANDPASTPMIPGWGRRSWAGPFAAYVWMDRGPGATKIWNRNQDILPSASDLCLQKAYAKVDKGDFNGQLFLAELEETLLMLRNPIAGLQKVLRQKDAGKLRKFADMSADSWCQVMFGIKPLIADIQAIYKAFNSLASSNKLLRTRSTVMAEESESFSETVPGNGLTYYKWAVLWKAEHKVCGRVYYQKTWTNASYDMAKKWGFDPISLPMTLWQTVPLSFVFDWFASVTLWLEALRPRPGIEILGNCVSEKLTQITSVSIEDAHLDGPAGTFNRISGLIGNDKFNLKIERLIRKTNLSIPTGIQWGNGVDSLGKAISSLSLTWQRLPRPQIRR